MSERDPFPNAEIAADYAIFLGLIVATGLGFVSRTLALGMMTVTLLAGLSILASTDCLGFGPNCAPFTFEYFGWEYIAAACLTLMSMLLKRHAKLHSLSF